VSQGEDRWSEGPEDGGTARTAAARCASELAGDGAAHLALVESGLAEALAVKAAELVRILAYLGDVQSAVMGACGLSWTLGRTTLSCACRTCMPPDAAWAEAVRLSILHMVLSPTSASANAGVL